MGNCTGGQKDEDEHTDENTPFDKNIEKLNMCILKSRIKEIAEKLPVIITKLKFYLF
jgi:hypothetical protein